MRITAHNKRHKLMAYISTQEMRVFISPILAPDDVMHAKKLAEFGMRVIEQGADYAISSTWNRREPRWACAANSIHEECLRAVICRMSRHDTCSSAWCTNLFRKLVGEL